MNMKPTFKDLSLQVSQLKIITKDEYETDVERHEPSGIPIESHYKGMNMKLRFKDFSLQVSQLKVITKG